MVARKKVPKKKTPAKRKAKETKSNGIKYADKSPGQPQLVPIFEKINRLLLPFAKGSLKIRKAGGQFVLVSEKEVEINGKKKPEVYFAGTLVQKGYVGFYFMPVYAEPGFKKQIQPELLSCLKGKSCFYIKKDDPNLFDQIEDALQLGYTEFKKKGWVD